MKARDERDAGGVAVEERDGAELLARPVSAAREDRPTTSTGGSLVIGELVAMTDDGRTPLVIYPGQAGTAAIRAKSIVDLHGANIGCALVLSFEAQTSAPIVLGVIRDQPQSLPEAPGSVEVDADGERLIVTAKEQIVVRCGNASITLTKAGKVLIHGEYISSRSSGVNRMKGGSVHLN